MRKGTRAKLPRLTQPMVKEHGVLRPASWEEALTRAAQGIQGSVAKHGPNTFGLFSCSKATNEVNYFASKFARTAIGTNHIDSWRDGDGGAAATHHRACASRLQRYTLPLNFFSSHAPTACSSADCSLALSAAVSCLRVAATLLYLRSISAQ